MSARTVLLTGATGFTGRHVARRLAHRGVRVVAFVRESSDRAPIADAVERIRVGDLADPVSLERALEGVDALVNVASLGFGHAPGIVAAASRAGVVRSVFLGTTAVRTTLPAPSKAVRLAAEEAVLGGGIGATLLRPTMIYGAPGDRNLERLVRLVRRFPVVPVPGDGRSRLQPVHVEDVATAIADVLPRTDLAGRAYDLPGPDPLTLDDVLRTIASALGRRRRLLHLPRVLARLVATREQVARLSEDRSANPAAAVVAFGFAPRSFAQGIAAEVEAMYGRRMEPSR